MTRHTRLFQPLLGFFMAGLLLSWAGCEKRNEQKVPEPIRPAAVQANLPGKVAPAETFTFEAVLTRAAAEEKFFSGLCRLLLTKSVLFALDAPPPAADVKAPAKTEKLSVKILKKKDSEGLGMGMIFSSKDALAAAGEKSGWKKNEKEMYDFAAMNGQAAFRVLKANGYQNVVLDAASPHAFIFNTAQMAALADGKIPPFVTPRKLDQKESVA